MDMLPPHHRARNLASSALESSDQATASAMSTALAQMNTFMDIALEQVICFDSNIDAEKFAKEKGISLTLADKLGDFDGGIVLSENGVDKNFTFDVEVALLKEQTEANVAKEIFG